MRFARGLGLILLVLLNACDATTDPISDAQFSVLSNANQGKVDVCHVRSDALFTLINVSVNALPAHRQHGDALPGETLPTDPSKKFTATCATVPAVVCPCEFSSAAIAMLNQQWGDLGADYEYFDGLVGVQMFSRPLPGRWTARFLALQAPKDNWPQAFECISRVYEPNVPLGQMDIIYDDARPATTEQAAVCRQDLYRLALSLNADMY